jgi:hypothetical protein
MLLAADSVLHCCTAAVGPTTESMVELNAPHLNFAAMAEGHGCKSTGKKTRLCCASLETKNPNIKPRQARDKHTEQEKLRENGRFFSRSRGDGGGACRAAERSAGTGGRALADRGSV